MNIIIKLLILGVFSLALYRFISNKESFLVFNYFGRNYAETIPDKLVRDYKASYM